MIIGPVSGFTPRPYQEHAVLGGDPRRGIGIMPAFARYKRVLAVMATGCGKTETFLWVIRRFLESIKTPPEKRAMVLAHRDELVGQPIERALRFGLRFAREQGPETALRKPERAIASTIQSMTANRVRAAASALGYRFEKKRKKDSAQAELAPVKREKGGKFMVWSPAGAELGRFDIEEFTKYFKAAHPGVPTCRMEEYDPNEIGLIVIDECHHAAADDYMRVLEYFIHAYVLGVTATPERLDGIGMEEVFEAVAYCYPIEEARPDGWLVDAYVSEHPIEELDLTQLRKRAGDLPPEALGELMAEYSMPVAANIVRLAGDRPTIVFCATVAHAHSQAAALRRYTDERVEVADGGTDKDIRRDVVADFRAGAVRFLVNAMLWTEGFDAPNASCIALVRPTCSRSLLLQCIGRGTRPEPGVVDRPELRNNPSGRVAAIASSNKPNLLVLDFTSQVKVVGLASPADVLAGRLTAEERLALAGIKLCGDKTIDELTREAIRLAAAAAAEAAALSDAVAEDAEVLDPWDPSIVMAMKLPRDDPREARCSPAQAAYLTRNGIEHAEKLSAARAKTLSGALAVRQKRNLCTYKQQLALQKVGVPPSTTTRMYMETAAKLIDQLVSNGWRRPRSWDDQPKLGGRAPAEARP